MVFRKAWCHLVMQYLVSRKAWCHLVICTWCQGWCLVPLVSYSNTLFKMWNQFYWFKTSQNVELSMEFPQSVLYGQMHGKIFIWFIFYCLLGGIERSFWRILCFDSHQNCCWRMQETSRRIYSWTHWDFVLWNESWYSLLSGRFVHNYSVLNLKNPFL